MGRRDQSNVELVNELRQLKYQQHEIARELVSRLSKETMQELKDGLVRYNYATGSDASDPKQVTD